MEATVPCSCSNKRENVKALFFLSSIKGSRDDLQAQKLEACGLTDQQGMLTYEHTDMEQEHAQYPKEKED